MQFSWTTDKLVNFKYPTLEVKEGINESRLLLEVGTKFYMNNVLKFLKIR